MTAWDVLINRDDLRRVELLSALDTIRGDGVGVPPESGGVPGEVRGSKK